MMSLARLALCAAAVAWLAVTATSAAERSEGTASAGEPAEKPPTEAPAPPKVEWPGFGDIFNGKDLDGWKARGADVTWEVRDGCLFGTQTTGKGGDLFTEKEWQDFELRVLYRVKWPANSGFWFRFGKKSGYQFDVLKWKKPVAFSGTLYCPGKMFITANLDQSIENRDGWNTARVWAKGDHLILWLNGRRTGECRDATHKKGRIGIQVHGGNQFKGMEIHVARMAVRPVAEDETPPSDPKPARPARRTPEPRPTTAGT